VAAATVDRVVRVANSTTMRRRLILSVGLLALAGAAVVAQDQAPDHQFTPNRIEVTKDDLVRITLTSEDRPYSFAIDAYHILKRVGAGKTIVFDFRADQAGAFAFYCNLTSDPGCRDMRGTLVVAPK
jgi:heme/copper-type cytochrome/quinol oxidase subunit 2